MKPYALKKPILLMIVGVACTGKTTLAKEISRKLQDSALLSKDLIQEPFVKDRSSEIYKDLRLKTYDILVDFADEQLSNNVTPIIEGPFSKNHQVKDRYHNWVEHFQKIADKHSTKLVIVQCRLRNDDDLRQRIIDRDLFRDKDKLTSWEDWINYEPQDFPVPHNDIIVLYSDKNSDLLSIEILEYINAEKN
jgi:adenylate kinase family enzyme